MGRVTRRSVASKEEATPKESPTSSGRRGAKKEKPSAEGASEGDSQETPKRGGRKTAKDEQKEDVPAKGKSTARGRSTSRGGRGKKEDELDSKETEDVESEEEVEEKKAPRGSTRSRGKGKAAQEEKTTKAVRGRRGVKSSEVEGTDDEDEDNCEKTEENNGPSKSSGRRARGKASAVTPSPRGERKGRGKATAEPDNEDKMDEDESDLKNDGEAETLDDESEVAPKGQQKHTATKEADSSEATPSPGARKGRNQKSTPKTSAASGRSSSRRSGGAENSADKTSEKEETTEDMDTAEGAETVNSQEPEENEKLPAETELEVKESLTAGKSSTEKAPEDIEKPTTIGEATTTTLTSETTPEKVEESATEKAATEKVEESATEKEESEIEKAATEKEESEIEKEATEKVEESATEKEESEIEKEATEKEELATENAVKLKEESLPEKASTEDSSIIEEAAMETEDTSANDKTAAKEKEESTSEMVVEESPEAASLSKKRKLEADEDDGSSEPGNRKKHKLEEADHGTAVAKQVSAETREPSQDDSAMLEDTEVTASLPALVAEKPLEPKTSEVTKQKDTTETPVVAASTVPVVPPPEAELGSSKEESAVAETGSNPPSDVVGASSIDLESSGAKSSVPISKGQASGDSTLEQVKESPSPNKIDVQQKQNAVPKTVEPSSPHKNSSGITQVPPAAAHPQDVQTPDSVTDASQPSKPLPEAMEVQTVSSPLKNASSENSAHIALTPCQNGTTEKSDVVNSGPHLSPSPNSKSRPTAHKPNVPSSTVINSRKFSVNPSFPVELMDPAYCISVVSYNILADCHLARSDYSYTQPQYLSQDYRHTLLLKELDYLDGDIVCLQEVGPSYYTQMLLPDMKSRGYDGHFIKRTQENMDEGEATFVRTSKLDIVSQQSASLKDLTYKEVENSGLLADVSIAAKKYLDRADVILLTEMKCKKTGKTLTVCNIHVYHDNTAPDVQCIQVACAIKQLVAKAGSDLNPHIICGDFNSDVTSPVYHLARDGYLSDDHIRRLQSLEALDNADGSSRSLIHHIWGAFQHTSSNLKNTYELALGKEPPLTYFRKTTKSLDHIFHSSASIDTVGVLETLDVEVLEATGGLPNKCLPSDHLPIKAMFRLK